MGMKYKKGDNVAQIVAPIVGVIVGLEIVDDVPQYKVSWVEGEDEHSRFFTEDQLQAVPAVAPEAPAV